MQKNKPLKYKVSFEALIDIEEISYRISEHNINSAKQLIERFYEVFETVSTFPFIGSAKPEFTNKNLRWMHVENYWIAYNPNSTPTEIVRIISTYMNVNNLL
jgi:plasmid stabilization system protein ParE